jgi:hypothetical protein
MSNKRDFEPIARAFMAGGPTQLADRVLESSLAEVHHTGQRRVLLRAPWRTPVMNIYAKLAAAAVVVVAVGALGVWFLSPGSALAPVGAPPASSVSPSASPTPSPTPEPSDVPSSRPTAPPLSQTFTSTRHGISLAVPYGWTTRPATESATEASWSSFLGYEQASADVIYNPVLTGELWLGIASIPLGESDPAQWPADQFGATECPSNDPVSVDGASGLIGVDFHSTECSVAFVATGGRGYQIRLYDSNDKGAYTRAWFEDLLARAQLTPEDAVD